MPALFEFDNTYARELSGLFVPWRPATAPAPRLLFLNEALADELRLDVAALRGDEGAALFAGNLLPEGAQPIAQAYAGHQFGGFSPQLGDGRALLIGEVIDRQGRRRDIAFKGSGRTPFSRGGDGKAAVGPMLREVLIGESMHALRIPTTRALAVAATGESVYREAVLPGAVLTRVASSHLRVGTLQYAAAQGQVEPLRRLVDYAIARHDPQLVGAPDRHPRFLRAVAERQAQLIAQWMNVGFIHGVMNTDNMTLSGETIDYGPCAFMDAYDPATVFSSIDRGGRYAYANQPAIARWNLARLAETLLTLMVDDPADEAAVEAAASPLVEVIDAFPGWYGTALLTGQRAKLGLGAAGAVQEGEDAALVQDWLGLLQDQSVDFTTAWRLLCEAAEAADLRDTPLRDHFRDRAALDAWLARWRARCGRDAAAGGPAPAERAARMRRTNPRIVPRNHRVEEALAAASDGELGPFERLLAALRRPFDDAGELAPYAEPAPAETAAGYRTYCGT